LKRKVTPQAVALLACAGLVVGSLGPWHSSVAGSQAGIHGGGLYTLALGVAAALLTLPRRRWLTVVVAIGALCTVITAWNVVDVAGSTREAVGGEAPSIEVGWGLWLAAIAAVTLTASAWIFRSGLGGGRRTPGTTEAALRKRLGEHPVAYALGALLVVGLALRVWLTIVWSPALTGYSDSGIYFQGAVESVWTDPVRMVGYPMFLRVLHAIAPHLILVVIVQHTLGLGAATLFFLAVRRCGGPSGLGLAPAAVVALGGDELFLEHAALSDALFIFLIAAMLYCALRASEDGLRWALLTGLFAGLGVWDRTAGLGLAIVIAVWLACSAGRPSRRSLAIGGASLAVALAVIGVYAGWRSLAVDQPGTLTSNNAWNLYGRVAPWADCTKFTPPPETEGLCEATPPSQRGYRSGEFYIFSEESPAQKLYGPPYLISTVPHAMERLQEWSEAAIRGQPLDYLHAVWRDTLRLLSPNTASYGDLSADAMVAFLLYGPDRHSGANSFVESWQSLLYPDDPAAHHADIGPFKTWEAITRIDNLWMALALALCLVGPWLLKGRARAGTLLFGATALLLLFFPILTKGYDYRFVIPAYAPLVAADALAAWGLVAWLRERGARGARPARPGPAG
jgi:hypothetical protein